MTIAREPLQQHDEVRQRLIARALGLFVERGYAATSVREIVAAAGVTKPVLYYYFNSKEGLYLEIMGQIGGLFDQRVNDLENSSGSVRQRLLHLFTGMYDGAIGNLPAVRLAYSIYFGPPQGAPFVDFNSFFDRLLELVERLVEQGVAGGELTECNRRALVWSLVGTYHTILEEQVCRTVPRMSRDDLVDVIGQILDGVEKSKRERMRS